MAAETYDPEALLVYVDACHPPRYEVVRELGEIIEFEKRPKGFTRTVRVRHLVDGHVSFEKAHQLDPVTPAAREILDMVVDQVGTGALAGWRRK